MPELYILLILMIAGAIIAVELKDLLSSVITVGVVGLILSMAFLILKAPDVAITQMVVEILCLIILIRATLNRSDVFFTGKKRFFNAFVTFGFIGMFLFVANNCIRDLPLFGYPLMRVAGVYIREGLEKTGAANLVSAVILDYRAYDTLGEATVLFAAVVGVLSLVRKEGRKKEGVKTEKNDE